MLLHAFLRVPKEKSTPLRELGCIKAWQQSGVSAILIDTPFGGDASGDVRWSEGRLY
jgi:hypothetical protein